ncbi:hypothetical protein TSA6c_17320 [Azospirillum sp. TSA6c]|uniref:hypothetical protein n=1 Tax=Azospirillum sp. TSA6c TaxID=709813 RepID=UPI000D60FDB5|nr:hypothetical protein [Azospirillum sp. TSA6c]PWC48183.1 hypothetical protein TSA6c_17320 [Azospirillum sp. TSA6c]
MAVQLLPIHSAVAPTTSTVLDELLEARSVAVRAHDAAPTAANRMALIDAASAYRREQGWDEAHIAADVASIHDRLNKVFTQ